MKVKQLISELETFDPEDEVYFVYNYGDYWQTYVAATLDYLEDGQVTWSEYHRMFQVVEDEQEPDESGHPVVRNLRENLNLASSNKFPNADTIKPGVLIWS